MAKKKKWKDWPGDIDSETGDLYDIELNSGHRIRGYFMDWGFTPQGTDEELKIVRYKLIERLDD